MACLYLNEKPPSLCCDSTSTTFHLALCGREKTFRDVHLRKMASLFSGVPSYAVALAVFALAYFFVYPVVVYFKDSKGKFRTGLVESP